MKFDLLNCLVSIGGADSGSTVPKFGVTPSEIAVLRAIHGNESVTDIEKIGDKESTMTAERETLKQYYGNARVGDKRIVDQLFPGIAAPLYTTIDQLELSEDFFKATGRATGGLKAIDLDEVEDESEADVDAEEPTFVIDEETQAKLDEIDAEQMPKTAKTEKQKNTWLKAQDKKRKAVIADAEEAAAIAAENAADGISDMPAEGDKKPLFKD